MTLQNTETSNKIRPCDIIGYSNPYEEFYVGSWPLPKSKVVFNGSKLFWFTNMIKNADDNLVIGQEYTLKTVEVASSSCIITLQETGDLQYSLSWFKYE